MRYYLDLEVQLVILLSTEVQTKFGTISYHPYEIEKLKESDSDVPIGMVMGFCRISFGEILPPRLS